MLLKHDRRTARRSTQVLEPVTSLRARHFLAYFAGEQPLRRATVLAVIGVPTISLVAMYVIGAVTPEDDAAAFAVYWLATTNVAMGIALWILWRCSHNTQSNTAKNIARGTVLVLLPVWVFVLRFVEGWL